MCCSFFSLPKYWRWDGSAACERLQAGDSDVRPFSRGGCRPTTGGEIRVEEASQTDGPEISLEGGRMTACSAPIMGAEQSVIQWSRPIFERP